MVTTNHSAIHVEAAGHNYSCLSTVSLAESAIGNMSMTRAGAVYGLTPEEQTQLESEDEEFFGYDPESESGDASEDQSDTDEVEELDDSELQSRISRATEQPGGENSVSAGLNHSLIVTHFMLLSGVDPGLVRLEV